MGIRPRDLDAKTLGALNQAAPKRSKYRNTKMKLDGFTFDSIKEADRWSSLRLLEKSGAIRDLQRQKRFKLVVNGALITTYVADFAYLDAKTGSVVIEDTKSAFTAKMPLYRIKKKLMAACLGLTISEV